MSKTHYTQLRVNEQLGRDVYRVNIEALPFHLKKKAIDDERSLLNLCASMCECIPVSDILANNQMLVETLFVYMKKENITGEAMKSAITTTFFVNEALVKLYEIMGTLQSIGYMAERDKIAEPHAA